MKARPASSDSISIYHFILGHLNLITISFKHQQKKCFEKSLGLKKGTIMSAVNLNTKNNHQHRKGAMHHKLWCYGWWWWFTMWSELKKCGIRHNDIHKMLAIDKQHVRFYLLRTVYSTVHIVFKCLCKYAYHLWMDIYILLFTAHMQLSRIRSRLTSPTHTESLLVQYTQYVCSGPCKIDNRQQMQTCCRLLIWLDRLNSQIALYCWGNTHLNGNKLTLPFSAAAGYTILQNRHCLNEVVNEKLWEHKFVFDLCYGQRKGTKSFCV